MTTVSSSSAASPTYTPTPTSSAATSTDSSQPYDSTAAVAQAEAQAAAALGNDSSSSTNGLLGLSSNVLQLLQGGEGSDMLSTLLGTTDATSGVLNSLLSNSLTQTALYAAAQKNGDAAESTDRINALITARNAASNAANPTTTDGTDTVDGGTDSADTGGTSGVDTTA